MLGWLPRHTTFVAGLGDLLFRLRHPAAFVRCNWSVSGVYECCCTVLCRSQPRRSRKRPIFGPSGLPARNPKPVLGPRLCDQAQVNRRKAPRQFAICRQLTLDVLTCDLIRTHIQFASSGLLLAKMAMSNVVSSEMPLLVPPCKSGDGLLGKLTFRPTRCAHTSPPGKQCSSVLLEYMG